MFLLFIQFECFDGVIAIGTNLRSPSAHFLFEYAKQTASHIVIYKLRRRFGEVVFFFSILCVVVLYNKLSNPNNLIPKFIVFCLLYFCSPESYIQEWEPCGKKTIKRKIIRSNSRSDSFHVSQLSKIENKMQTFDFVYRNVLRMLPCVQYDAASIQWVILIRDFIVFVWKYGRKKQNTDQIMDSDENIFFFFVDKVSGSGHASFIPWPITKIAFHPERARARARGENQNRFSSRWIMLNTLKHYLVMTRNKWEYAWVWFFCTLIEWVILCIYVDRFF